MGFQEGHARFGGRKAGTPNKPKYDVAERLEKAGVDAVDEIVKLLPQLDVQSRAKTLLALLQYVAVKPTAPAEEEANEGPQEKLLRWREAMNREREEALEAKLREAREAAARGEDVLAILDRPERPTGDEQDDVRALTEAVRRARAEAAATGQDPSTVLVRVG